jgi:polar amino acid transport system substrate-binding protein
MKRRKMSILEALLIMLLLTPFRGAATAGSLQNIEDRGKLIAGVNTDFPPFGFLDEEGKNEGLDVDLAKILAREALGKESVEFVGVTGENRIALLNSGEIDVLSANMTITEKRGEKIDFSIPYFISGYLILVPKHSSITNEQDLAGLKVATIQGSTADSVVGKLVPTADRVRFEKDSEALQALKDGRVAAFVQDDALVIDFQEKNPDLKIADFHPFDPAPYGLGVRKGDKEWLNFINATLTRIEGNGEYHRILDRWFGEVRGLLLYSLLEEERTKSIWDLMKLLEK